MSVVANSPGYAAQKEKLVARLTPVARRPSLVIPLADLGHADEPIRCRWDAWHASLEGTVDDGEVGAAAQCLRLSCVCHTHAPNQT